MEYELTDHAKQVMVERKIPVEYLERTLAEPDRKYDHMTDKELQHRLKVIPENENRVLCGDISDTNCNSIL